MQKFKEVCQTVMEAAKKAPTNSGLQYAAAYAKAGLAMTSVEEIKTQALYVSANLSTWRGLEARETKKKLIKVAQELTRMVALEASKGAK